MTKKEIVDYSKKVIDMKDDISSSEITAPDLQEQVINKFAEDEINRANFIDSVLMIDAATMEFRNIFGIQAPCYELSKCKLGVDSNGNGRYDDDEIIKVTENIKLDNSKLEPGEFWDCKIAINAANFDSSQIDNEIPVDNQPFFIDKKKDDESSSMFEPMQPPGYERWAGSKLYDYICRRFDLTEPVMYNIVSNIQNSTISSQYTIGYFDSDNNVGYNIKDGLITSSGFSYEYTDNSGLINRYNDGYRTIPKDGVEKKDIAPITWYTIDIPVTSLKRNGLYEYTYDFTGSIFENTNNPIVAFSMQEKYVDTPFCEGYAILSRDQFQTLELSGTKSKSTEKVRFCMNILYSSGDMEVEATERTGKFLWWTWTKKKPNKHGYFVYANPVEETFDTATAKKYIAKYIYNMYNEAYRYYQYIENRQIKNIIPNYQNSMNSMKTVIDASRIFSGLNLIPHVSWNDLKNAIGERMKFIFNTDDISFLNPGQQNSQKQANIPQTSKTESNYILRWESSIIPGWPKFLRRVFKSVSEPVYVSREKFTINFSEVKKDPTASFKTETISSKDTYFGPSSGDFTKLHGGTDNGITLAALLGMLDADQKSYLKDIGQYDDVNNTFKIAGTNHPIENTTKYDVEILHKEIIEPVYSYIDRARKLDAFLVTNQNLYDHAYAALSNRINKRTGTLRKVCSLRESAEISAQMNEQKKKNIKELYSYLNAYKITGGYGSNELMIECAPWEPYTTVFSNLPRMSSVVICNDYTEVDKDDNLVYESEYIETIITDIIDMQNDVEYSYSITKDIRINENKKYYSFHEGKYVEATEDELLDENIENLYEIDSQSTKGPVFKVRIANKLPTSYKNRNPRLITLH